MFAKACCPPRHRHACKILVYDKVRQSVMSKAKQSKAKQSKAEQSKAKQSMEQSQA
jgi:hypothetical protein